MVILRQRESIYHLSCHHLSPFDHRLRQAVAVVEHYLFHIFNLHFFDKSHSTAPYSRLISCVDCTDK